MQLYKEFNLFKGKLSIDPSRVYGSTAWKNWGNWYLIPTISVDKRNLSIDFLKFTFDINYRSTQHMKNVTNYRISQFRGTDMQGEDIDEWYPEDDDD